MNTFLILLVFLIILYFSFNNLNQENFVQVKSNYNPNKNTKMIKPVQVTDKYVPPNKTYDRDDWVSGPKNSPNIAPNLIKPNDDLPGTGDFLTKNNYPGSGNNNFEQANNKDLPPPKIIYPETENEQQSKNSNLKNIRQGSGQLIRPLELDSSPSSEYPPEKPYITGETPQPNSEYLDYANVPVADTSNYEIDVIQENNKMDIIASSKNGPELVIETEFNDKNKLSDIAKKLIKKAAQLSVISTQSDDPIQSVQKANYAIGYLDALQDIMTDAEIANLVDIDLNKFRRELNKVQSHNISSVKLRCPSLSTDKRYLLDIATKL
jgi:hypothetical protein